MERGIQRFYMRALRKMNSGLQAYPVLKDIKRLERDRIQCASPFGNKAVLLDVGCGLGEDMHALKDNIAGNIFGIDVNPLPIMECERHPRLRFFVMDTKQMGFKDSTFDVSYVTVNTLGNYELAERHRWLKEILRVSKQTLLSLYLNTQDYEEMRIEDRIHYYRNVLGATDTEFDGRQFLSTYMNGWRGRLFTEAEIKEMFRIHGIHEYEIERLNEILLNVRIPAQPMNQTPDLSQVQLLHWDQLQR